MTGTFAFIQARMSSSRFPGKVLETLGGLPMIVFMVQRVRRAASIDDAIVLTSNDPTDDILAEVLVDHGVPFFRGELTDVLSRYAAAAQRYSAERIVRLTGDCPLIDPAIIDQVVSLLDEGCDYASNISPATYADGFDTEAFTRHALDRAVAEACLPSEREHVTLWMRKAESGLKASCRHALADTSHIRLTVDYPDDLEMVRHVVDMLGAFPDQYDILRCLDQNPSLLEINHHDRNEGLTRSAAKSG